MKALIIGSDTAIINFATLAIQLRWPDSVPWVAPKAAGAVALIDKLSPDVVLLHADHAGLALSETIQEVRRFTMAPLLVLGCHGKEVEVVTALTLGADDYVKLPCKITELTVRVWATFRRAGLATGERNATPLRSGSLLLNGATHEVFLGDRGLRLTPTEFRLLRKLMENGGAVVTHRTLELTMFERDSSSRDFSGEGLVKKYIQRLRSKLGDNARAPRWVACIHGIGYRFVGPTPTKGHLDQPPGEPARKLMAGVPADTRSPALTTVIPLREDAIGFASSFYSS